MPGKIRKLLSQEELVAKLIEIRKAYPRRFDFLSHVNDWFLTDRLTKQERHLAFIGLYQAFNEYSTMLGMAEMMDMWHLCQMEDYIEPQPVLDRPISDHASVLALA